MNKAIITLFILIMSSVAIFAQRGDNVWERNLRNDPDSLLEKCYKNTTNFYDFERCYKNKDVPTCPKEWNMEKFPRNWDDRFPCKITEPDIYNDRRLRDGERNYGRDESQLKRTDFGKSGSLNILN